MGMLDKLKELTQKFKRERQSPPAEASLPPVVQQDPPDLSLVSLSDKGRISQFNPESNRITLLETVETKLQTQPEGWTEDEYSLGRDFLAALKDRSLETKEGFVSKTVRAILESFVTGWNLKRAAEKSIRTRNSFQSKSAGKLIDKNAQLFEKLEAVFSALVLAIQHALTEKYEDDLLRYLKARPILESPDQKEFSVIVIRSEKLPLVGGAVINIDEHKKTLDDFYQFCMNDYGVFHHDPELHLKKAREALRGYFTELQKVNMTTASSNPWRLPVVQKALRYYFDQRELLYTIDSQVRACPELIYFCNRKLELMAEYRNLMIEHYQRNEAYDKNITINGYRLLGFGYSRLTKIAAGHDQYLKLSRMEGDLIPKRSEEDQALIEAAGENGRLGALNQKRLGLMG